MSRNQKRRQLRRLRRRWKPLLTPLTAKYMRAIYEDFCQRDRGQNDTRERQAACDVLDGWAITSELRPLARQGIIVLIPCEREDWRELGGEMIRHFAELTDYGLALLRQWRAKAALVGEAHDAAA